MCVSPVVRIGSPRPLTLKRVLFPLCVPEGRHTRLLVLRRKWRERKDPRKGGNPMSQIILFKKNQKTANLREKYLVSKKGGKLPTARERCPVFEKGGKMPTSRKRCPVFTRQETANLTGTVSGFQKNPGNCQLHVNGYRGFKKRQETANLTGTGVQF
jgi:hypothetical protein